MIFFVGNGGTVIKGLPSPVYQGSANANTVYLIAPFASNTQVTLAFKLPNGSIYPKEEPAAMTAQGALEGVKNGQTGQTYAGWTYDLPNAVTALYGVVTVQFFFHNAEGKVTASSSVSFNVGQGVPPVLPDAPSDDVYEQILANIGAMQEQLNNGFYASRAVYAWNSTYTYGAGEITFYPDIGNYGAFVKSVVANNTGNTPYTDGAINSAFWSEVVNFNTVTDDFFAEIKEAQAAAEAAEAGAEAAQSAAEAAQTAAETAQGKAETAQTAAETAQGKAETAQAAAETAQTAAETAEGNAKTSETNAASSASAAAGSATSASGSASEAATSAQNAQSSASAAAGSATAAQNAQTAAETAETNAENSAGAAATSAGQAGQSASAASTSASQAESARIAAEAAKTAAQTAQSGAQTAESNAGTYAGNASGSASAAAQSAVEAQAYMEQAKQYAQKEYQIYDSFEELPNPGDSAYIYLVPASGGSGNDSYSEYLWITETGKYEFIGNVNDVDLSGYAQVNGTYPNMTVGNATNAVNATNATNAENATSAASATKATQDGSGNNIASTYATKTELTEGLTGKQPTGNYALQNGTYPDMTVGNATNAVNATNAESATSAASATKATQDGAGNVIADTYATKTEVTEGLAGKQPTGNYALQTGSYPSMTVGNASNATNAGHAETADGATNADSATKATQDGSGNNIVNTYATKTELNNSLATKANTSGYYKELRAGQADAAGYADQAELATQAQLGQSGVPSASDDNKIVTTEYLYPGSAQGNGVSSFKFVYRGVTHSVNIQTSYVSTTSNWMRVVRSGNTVTIGWTLALKSTTTLRKGTNYTIASGLPNAAHTENNYCVGIAPDGTVFTVYVNTSGQIILRPQTGNLTSQTVYLGCTYLTNEA